MSWKKMSWKRNVLFMYHGLWHTEQGEQEKSVRMAYSEKWQRDGGWEKREHLPLDQDPSSASAPQPEGYSMHGFCRMKLSSSNFFKLPYEVNLFNIHQDVWNNSHFILCLHLPPNLILLPVLLCIFSHY